VPNAKVIFIGTKSDLRGMNYDQKELSIGDIQKNLKEELGCEYF
jgi:hypothetical protein